MGGKCGVRESMRRERRVGEMESIGRERGVSCERGGVSVGKRER